jgi:hypothetical protein
MATDQKLNVIELRNYLLKPGNFTAFNNYFQQHFVKPQKELRDGYLPGQYHIKDQENKFFWIRGFTDMEKRLAFLKNFYDESDAWRIFGAGANDLMLNSDHVHLLKPLNDESGFLKENDILSIEYYTANDKKLDELIELYKRNCLSLHGGGTSLWITELSKSEFRHPVIQDKNLFVAIRSYNSKITCEEAIEKIAEQTMLIEFQQLIQHTETLILINANS